MSQATTPQKIYLKDYTPPAYAVKKVDLDICLYEQQAIVSSRLEMTRQAAGELVLLGRDLQLQQVSVNGEVLSSAQFRLDSESLTLIDAPDRAIVETKVIIKPQTNTTLEGLYQSGLDDEMMFVTQCEPEGFRKITFFPDRPDVLSEYTTRLEAPKTFKTLLANGNLVEAGEVGDDRHYTIWHDPTKKPSYLFAAVIANLQVLQDHYTTSEGRKVLLELYAVSQDIDKCHVAMQALKDSMKWDEDNYGRAYDLDRYMIVATSQFNMGAMENKGLNIFNTSCVLSSPETATDERSFNVKAVIAHEYFHNWTGNRITCRDWFQLCLKEGFTVFRDQSFSGDFRSKAVQRIEDVAILRSAQFAEDAGTLAHPVRPESFVEINNFYTATVYEKGAEIVRMLANLLGKEKFRQGTDEYFARYDGQAVTVEDFLSALSVADERVLAFMPWYRQPGTPVLSGGVQYEQDKVVVRLAQKTRHVPNYDAPVALPIPVDTAIFDSNTGQLLAEKMLLLTTDSAEFVFDGIQLSEGGHPVVSVLRNFSAPVRLEFDYSDEDLVRLVSFETEGFNRWQAMQTLVNRWLFGSFDNVDSIAGLLKTVTDELLDCDPMLAARLFDVPSQKELAMAYDSDYDPVAVKARRDEFIKLIACALADKTTTWYQALPIQAYEDTPLARGRRLLRNVLLDLRLLAGDAAAEQDVYYQYDNATCMSERLGAFTAIINHDLGKKSLYIANFYEKFANEDLVIDAWFNAQALSSRTSIDDIAALMQRQDYDWNTPNRVRTTLGALAAKPVQLWTQQGMALYLSAVERLDGSNPLLAARLLSALARWYTLGDDTKAMAQSNLEQLKQKVQSKNVLEFLDNMLTV
ncbi:aminopeptidase N [Moraxella cuniculi DSM 21768]|uniref:Aminopeptidase N n=1 Tax=Moraxella cuniculi DSM 21768 TaxID=1122245 RepID=A0A1N7DAH5_9GAMM|nr:aminopeptidase N [Moraxella cuniculi]OOS07939.1 aminopeptidase N [Moraxella cuniculi]SIR72828.1 aminopeptidase N [Moraxella cuniculi DSM 21768]